MGRWGYGLFEGDYDLDAIEEIFDHDVKKPLKKEVVRLRLKAWEEKQIEKKSGEDGNKSGSAETSKKPSKKELQKDWEYDVNLYHLEYPRLVRDYLDSGVLAFLIRLHGPKKPNSRWSEDHGHKDLVLIAFCAMELGCTLPPGFLARLKANYRRVGLIGEELEQIRRGCEEYVNGKPYNFVSLGLVETASMSMDGETKRPEPRPPGLEPVPAEETVTTAEEPASKRRKIEPKATAPVPAAEEYDLVFPADTCANCGATQGHGSPDLKRCMGCKTTLYCFEGCQKWHWFRHRCHCKVNEKPEESAEQGSIDGDGDASEEDVESVTA
ncbi:hypothetical protein DHEL01_v210057 [Diaporthe helianthi]|uniref:MYND-type domain-containing protein n=1 Tax=Diaporthe helianthi TaxID=158607 RepID=A0A2P5HMQ6_DIAHE|nr:hypothetical protein DHEL01_v210057 [Diaporthe helianthi]